MLISIIVAIYNVEKYLDKCIQSIISQHYKDIEVILVDDGSPDSSPSICDDWAKKDKRIKVIHKKNGGVSSARNAGIEKAKGKYITFVDGDDFISTSFSNVVDKIQDYSYVCCSYNSIVGNNSHVVMPIADSEGDLKNNLIVGKITSGMYNSIWNKFYDRNIIITNNIRFDESLVIAEDLKFNLDYFAIVKDLRFINIPYYNYVENPNSAMHTVSYSKISNCLTVCEYGIQLLADIPDKNNQLFLKRLISQNLLSVLNKANTYSKENNKELQTRLIKVKKFISYGETFIKKIVVIFTKVLGVKFTARLLALVGKKI